MHRVSLGRRRHFTIVGSGGGHWCLREDDGGTGLQGHRAQDGYDRRDPTEGAPHGVEPADETGVLRLTRAPERTHEGCAENQAASRHRRQGRPLKFFITAGQVSDYAGAATLLGSLHAAE